MTTSGNHVIFIHPDGASPSHFGFARFIDHGLDGRLNWDRMEAADVYLGHREDQLGGTSNGGAITHATGAKVNAESFGYEQGSLPITSLDGSNNTIVEAAIQAGKVTALVQSGAIFEPGTAAFVSKTEEIVNPNGTRVVPRAQAAEIARQVIESGVNFIFSGGELNLLPVGVAGFHGTAARYDALSTSSSVRPTQNLIELAQSLGYTVVYTKDQLNSLINGAVLPQKVLGVFAPVHTFNHRAEEQLAAAGLPFYSPTARRRPSPTCWRRRSASWRPTPTSIRGRSRSWKKKARITSATTTMRPARLRPCGGPMRPLVSPSILLSAIPTRW